MTSRHNDVVSGKDLQARFLGLTRKFRKSIDLLTSSKIAYALKRDIISLSPIDALRFSRDITSQESEDRMISSLLLNTVNTSENLSPGSGLLASLFLCNFYSDFYKSAMGNSSMNIQEIERQIMSDVSKFSHVSKRSNSDQIFKAVNSYLCDKKTFELFRTAINLAGSAGNIEVSISNEEETNIKNTVGYRFLTTVDNEFVKNCDFRKFDVLDSKIAVIDGIIESYDEISSIAQLSHEKNQPVVIFSRGYSETVSNILARNFASKALTLIPMVVNYDERGANMLVDIAVCVGTDVTSSLKGDAIDKINFYDLPLAKKISIDTGRLTFFDESFSVRCRQHKNRLIKQISELQESSTEVLQLKTKILSQRISSMSPASTNIVVGLDNGEMSGIRYDRLCKSIQIYNEMSRWGLVDLRDIHIKSQAVLSAINVMTSRGVYYVSPRGIDSAARVAISNSKSLISVGAGVCSEKAA